MPEKSILIVDNNARNVEILSHKFGDAEFDVEIARNNHEALSSLSNRDFDVILTDYHDTGIDGFEILEHTLNGNDRQASVVFLSPKKDDLLKQKCFKLGVKDYIEKPSHVSEIISRVSSLVQKQNTFTGNGASFNAIQIIQELGYKKESLRAFFKNNNDHQGILDFKDGQIINAQTDQFLGKAAVMRIMSWKKTSVKIEPAKFSGQGNVFENFDSLVQEGVNRLKDKEQLLASLPPLEAIVTTTDNFKQITEKQPLEKDLKQFVGLFNGKRTLGGIIDDCDEDELVTLGRILKLYELGFINVSQDYAIPPLQSELDKTFQKKYFGENDEPILLKRSIVQEDQISFTEQVLNNLEKSVQKDKNSANGKLNGNGKVHNPVVATKPVTLKSSPNVKKKPSIFVLGDDDNLRVNFFEAIVQTEENKHQLDINGMPTIYFGEARFKGGHSLNISTFSIKCDVTPFVEYFDESIYGFIFLLNANAKNYSYYQYLLNVLKKKIAKPMLVGLYNQEGQHIDLEEYRKNLKLDDKTLVVNFDDLGYKTAMRFLFDLFKNYKKK